MLDLAYLIVCVNDLVIGCESIYSRSEGEVWIHYHQYFYAYFSFAFHTIITFYYCLLYRYFTTNELALLLTSKLNI